MFLLFLDGYLGVELICTILSIRNRVEDAGMVAKKGKRLQLVERSDYDELH